MATKVGAKIVHPNSDLSIKEKKELVQNIKTKDEHQSDALATSVFAYDKIKNKLSRIDSFLEEHRKEKLRSKIIELVILEEISIRNAIDIIEKPEKEEVKIIKKVIEEKELTKNDFVDLYNKLKSSQREVLFLRKQNNNLKRVLKNKDNNHQNLLKKFQTINFDQEAERLISHKEKRILSFDRQLKTKDEELHSIKENARKMSLLLANINNYYILKKLKNLGSLEFTQKNSFLDIGKSDMLLVENPGVFSGKVVDALKEKITVILCRNQVSSKIKKELPFSFIHCKDLDVFEIEDFAFVEKEALDRKTKNINLLNTIINQYRSKN